MQGERVDSMVVQPSRIDGDREFAVVAAETGLVLSAKRESRLLEASATTVDGEVVVNLPGGASFAAAAADAGDRLSSWLGRDVAVARVGDGPVAYDMTLDPPNDDADVYEIPMPPDTFLDLAAVHVLTEASFATMAASEPQLQWDLRRFRPNVLVADAADGYPEDAWVGGEIGIGADVRLGVMMRTMRCAMPLRAQPAAGESPALERSTDIYRALQGAHANDLGVYCSVSTTGEITAGDEVVEIASPAADT